MAVGLACSVLIRRARESAKETGALSVRVYDARSGETLQGATVVLPEYGKSVITGKTGRTGKIMLSVRRDTRFDGMVARDWGEITLLIYCDGYYPCALFHVAVRAGTDREGPHVFLLPEDGSMAEPYTLIESPPLEWVSALLSRYEP